MIIDEPQLTELYLGDNMEVGHFVTVPRFRLEWLRRYFNYQQHGYVTSACLKIIVLQTQGSSAIKCHRPSGRLQNKT